jgi:uncharacterized protein YndB with AHSA1/START domain
MSRVRTSATIARSPAEVFAYVTTPRTWPAWQQWTLGTIGDTHHSLDVAERFTEQYVMGGRRGGREWFVRERDPERRWTIEMHPQGGGSGTLTYEFSADGAGTLVECEFEYDMPNVALRVFDALVMRRRVEAEAAEGMRRLKERLESAEPALGRA